MNNHVMHPTNPNDITSQPPLGQACGKAILLGEHSVVHGSKALVAGLPESIIARDGGTYSDSLRISVEPWGLSVNADRNGNMISRALHILDSALDETGIPVNFRRRHIKIRAKVPSQAGLGSSAALTIAITRLIAILAKRHDLLTFDKLTGIAALTEAVFHGSASGVDAAAAARGGVCEFDKSNGLVSLLQKETLHLLIANTGKRPAAFEMIQHVDSLMKTNPQAVQSIEQLGNLAAEGALFVQKGDLLSLGRAMNVAHDLLAFLGLSTREIDSIVSEAQKMGALGAKITGAGGGGCIICLCEPQRIGSLQSFLNRNTLWSRYFALEPCKSND